MIRSQRSEDAFRNKIQGATIRLRISSTKMSAYSPRLETELEEMERYIVDVKYMKNQTFDVSELVAGWPTETYAWILKQRDNKGRRQ